MDHIQFVKGDLTPLMDKPNITLPKDMVASIDLNPEIMVGADVKTGKVQHYYYDKLSGTLSDIPVNGDSIAIPKDKLDDVLLRSNMSVDSIDKAVRKIVGDAPMSSSPSASTSSTDAKIPKLNETTTTGLNTHAKSSSNDYTWVIVGTVLGVVLVIAIIVFIVLYTRRTSVSA